MRVLRSHRIYATEKSLTSRTLQFGGLEKCCSLAIPWLPTWVRFELGLRN